MKIFAETENYWCAIQHKEGGGFIPQSHHAEFIKYNNKELHKKYIDENVREIYDRMGLLPPDKVRLLLDERYNKLLEAGDDEYKEYKGDDRSDDS